MSLLTDTPPIHLPSQALSIIQPWAWLIAHGHKTWENRDWTPGYPPRHFRGPFCIHASSKKDRRGHSLAQAACADLDIALPPFGSMDLHYGGIIGVATVTDWHDQPDRHNPFAFGSGLSLADAAPIPFIAVKGALGFFNWSPSLH